MEPPRSKFDSEAVERGCSNQPVLEFAYHRNIHPTLAMLLGLTMAETLVVHLLASRRC